VDVAVGLPKPALRLLPVLGPESPACLSAGPSLAAAPFRPGELPAICWLTLDESTRQLARDGASAARVPVELWIRTAVEGARLLDELAPVTGRERSEVCALFDDEALYDEIPDELSSAPLRAYAAMLERGGPSGALETTVALRISEEMAGSWRHAAVVAQRSLPQWVGDRLGEAPPGCMAWERAAAMAHRTLAEWGYASSMRRIAASSASAQRV
jgi:hypothetical protein